MNRRQQQQQYLRCILWLTLTSLIFQSVQSESLSPLSSSSSQVPVGMSSPLTDTEFIAPTVSPVSRPPNPGYPACVLCGEGRSIRFPERTVQFPNQPEISCQALQEAAIDGYIPSTLCPAMPDLVGDACVCDDDDSPSLAPVDSLSPTTAMSYVGRKRITFLVGLVSILNSLVEIVV